MGFRYKLTRLRPGQVTAAELADGSVTAPKIAASAVVAGKVDADAISVRELTVGGLSPNLVPNGSFDDGLTGWTVDYGVSPSARAWQLDSAGAVWGAEYAFTNKPAGGAESSLGSTSFPVRGGEFLNLSALLESDGPSTLYLLVYYGLVAEFPADQLVAQVAAEPESSAWYQLDGTAAGNPATAGQLGRTGVVYGDDPAVAQWFEVRARFQVPTQARWARIVFVSGASAGATFDYLHGVDVRRSITGDLIVNGAIDGELITGARLRTRVIDDLNGYAELSSDNNFGATYGGNLLFYQQGAVGPAGAAAGVGGGYDAIELAHFLGGASVGVNRLGEVYLEAPSVNLKAGVGGYVITLDSAPDSGGIASSLHDLFLMMAGGAAGQLYIRNRANTAYRPINASAFVVNSQREAKTNIADLPFSALDAVLAAAVYEFDYLPDEHGVDDPVGKRIGPMVEDVPESVQNGDGTGINVAAMAGLVWAAVQELADRLEALERGRP